MSRSYATPLEQCCACDPRAPACCCSPCPPVAGSADCSAQAMHPQESPHRYGIIRRSFHAANVFESIQRKIQRQASEMELHRRKRAYAKFTILDMLSLSHKPTCFACRYLRFVARFRKNLIGAGKQARHCIPPMELGAQYLRNTSIRR